tara:strand:- start:4805 stop:5515 length:711 start_codon:yes stop_codon:yes gene_type:complete
MDLVYSICYYYERNNTKNIKRHIKLFKALEQEKKYNSYTFVITCMTDTLSKKDKIECELSVLLNDKDVKHKMIIEFNWGGTIVGLWLTHNEYKNTNSYICHFEEDFVPINVDFLEKSIDLLTKNDYVYIGESNRNKIKTKDDDGRLTKKRFKKSIRLGDPEVWTDGGYYFSTTEKLKQAEEKIGIFHRGDRCSKYKHDKDGIDLGEVGFPTLLHHAGFAFGFLNRKEYFVHNEKKN